MSLETSFLTENQKDDGLVLSMNENSEDYQTCEILNVIRHDMQVLMDSWVQSKSIARFDKESGEQVKS